MSAPVSQLSATDTALLDKLPDGVAYYEAIRELSGPVTDFRLIYFNPLFGQLAPALFRQSPPSDSSATQLQQSVAWPSVVDRYATVIETGQIAELVISSTNKLASVCLRAAPFSNGVLVTVRVVSLQSPNIENQWFDDVLNASLSNTYVYETIRNETGQIQDFRILFANRHARQDVKNRFGIEAVGSALLASYPGLRQHAQFQHCVNVIETGKPVRLELHYQEIDAWYETMITQLGDGCIVTSLDITSRKQNELNIRQQATEQERMVQELRQSNENLRQFAQVASHDLQEPLRKIQTFCDILENQFEDNLSDGERDMARRIQKSAQRMRLLLKDLLTYSQLAAQRDPLEPVALDRVVEEVTSDLELAIAEKNATVQVGQLPTVLGSSPRLRQLIQNLIANALKFQHPGQAPHIRISARRAKSGELPAELPAGAAFWLITVADNGLGFNEKYKDRIFHPFQRLHDPTIYSGTGIGLAICQRVAESLGGAIDVNSAPGEGSSFKIYLPVYSESA